MFYYTRYSELTVGTWQVAFKNVVPFFCPRVNYSLKTDDFIMYLAGAGGETVIVAGNGSSDLSLNPEQY